MRHVPDGEAQRATAMDGDFDPCAASERRCAVAPAEGPLRVLLVEDEPLLAMNAASLLESAGLLVVGPAATAAEAAALADRDRPQVAVVDLNLRDGMTGLAIVDRLVAHSGCVVVMATGQPQDVPASTPAHAVLRKPYPDHALIAAVSAALAAAGLPALHCSR